MKRPTKTTSRLLCQQIPKEQPGKNAASRARRKSIRNKWLKIKKFVPRIGFDSPWKTTKIPRFFATNRAYVRERRRLAFRRCCHFPSRHFSSTMEKRPKTKCVLLHIGFCRAQNEQG
jgi:hypothetical protein